MERTSARTSGDTGDGPVLPFWLSEVLAITGPVMDYAKQLADEDPGIFDPGRCPRCRRRDLQARRHLHL